VLCLFPFFVPADMVNEGGCQFSLKIVLIPLECIACGTTVRKGELMS